MFEHLDDPDPYVPSDGLRREVAARGRKIRRRRKVAAGGASLLVVLLVGMAGAAAFVGGRVDDLQRVEVAGVGDPVDPSGPQVVLLAGVDSDEGLGPGDPIAEGRSTALAGEARADSIVLARTDPGSGQLVVLPLPRDLLVEIPGHGRGRINSALSFGGPDLLVQTVEDLTGVDVDRYVETDFAGAIAIADALGGVRVDFPNPVRDRRTALSLDAGCQVVSGRDLLALGRSRHLEWQRGAGWANDLTSDVGRIERQQVIAVGALDALRRLNVTDPAKLLRVLDAVADNLVVDSALDGRDLIALLQSLHGADLVQLRLPVADAFVDGASVLTFTEGADQVIDQFRAGQVLDPGSVPSDAPVTPAGQRPFLPVTC